MSKSILVADDEKSIRNLYTRIFSGTDYSVTLAETVAEAAGFIENNNYDLLITDLMFPDGLGTELVRAYSKKRGRAKSIIVTGAPNAAEILRSSGITEYFEKPFKVAKLLAVVSSVLSERGG